MFTIAVQTRTFGKQRAQGEETVILKLGEELITVADLIRRTVEELVREEVLKHWLATQAPDQPENVSEISTNLPIASWFQTRSDREPVQPTRGERQATWKKAIPDEQVQVRKALQAFETGSYLVLVDKRRLKVLDEEIAFTPDSQVMFLRLTPLVGG